MQRLPPLAIRERSRADRYQAVVNPCDHRLLGGRVDALGQS